MIAPNIEFCHTFFNTSTYILLTLIIYVDDLLLAGPSEEHIPFWEKLGKLVDLDPYEELDRYLGRHHSFEACDRLDFSLTEYFKSPVEV